MSAEDTLTAMRFELVDRVVEQSATRIVTLKCVTGGEEYLADHFPTFPVLPGVMMLECMVQAARRLLDTGAGPRLVLGRVRALKYGRMVKPGDTLRVEVTLHKAGEDGSVDVKGEVGVLGDPEGAPLAASGRLTMRGARTG
jgi:3-hydroxyacyl-[acyl-carrier-protein] dehydratase